MSVIGDVSPTRFFAEQSIRAFIHLGYRPWHFQTNDPCVEPNVEPVFIDGFIGDISEGRFVMHFNRDSSGHVTSFDAATDMVRPMRFLKVADHTQK